METFTLHRGMTPLLVSVPHDGTELPADIATRMTDAAARLPDTDWHTARLYGVARELGASLLVPRYSRYVVDLNRPSDGSALYPGRQETGLVPTITFGGEPIYRAGEEPDAAETRARVRAYWRPYHAAIAEELARLRALHGRALLWDGHSIRSRVPMFFEGRLPDLNLGTGGGRTCHEALRARLADVLASADGYSHVVDGRFKGGYITRHYGEAGGPVESVQLELAQETYMDEASGAYDEVRAVKLQGVIRGLLQVCLDALTARRPP